MAMTTESADLAIERDRRISQPRRAVVERRVGERRLEAVSVRQEGRRGGERRGLGDRRHGAGRRRGELGSAHPATVLFGGHDAADVRLLRKLFAASPPGRFALETIDGAGLARERLRRGDVDAVLLDLAPAGSLEAVVALAAAEPAAPILGLSPVEDERLGLQAVQAGAQDFLVKDRLDGTGLVQSVRYAIERHRLRTQLRDLSFLDDLTGLYNRRGFVTLATQDVRVARRAKQSLLLAFGDLDGLKQINDTLGHAEGDAALRDVSGILRRTFRESDLIARIGGDEFAVLVRGAEANNVEVLRQRMKDELQQFTRRARRRYRLEISLGFAHRAAASVVAVASLLGSADRALYQEKRRRDIEGRDAKPAAPRGIEGRRYDARPVEILLVEDDPHDVALARQALEHARLLNRMSVVSDGLEALAFLRGEAPFKAAAPPDVVLLDLKLPKKDGRAVLREMRQDRELRHIPVVMLTTTQAEHAEFAALHPDAFLTKPVDFPRLAQAVLAVANLAFTIVKLSA